MMSEQAPQPLHQRQRDRETERRDVSLQEGSDEVAPPVEAVVLVPRHETLREAAPHPEGLPVGRPRYLHQEEWGLLDVGDASCQGLVRLPDEVPGRRAKDEEAPRVPVPVDLRAQCGEEAGEQLYRVQANQPGAMVLEEELGLCQPGPVDTVLKVEVDRVKGGDPVFGEGRLFALARSQDDRRRRSGQGAPELRFR